jgi:hypothetical protein
MAFRILGQSKPFIFCKVKRRENGLFGIKYFIAFFLEKMLLGIKSEKHFGDFKKLYVQTW